jgi:hypothetical protein
VPRLHSKREIPGIRDGVDDCELDGSAPLDHVVEKDGPQCPRASVSRVVQGGPRVDRRHLSAVSVTFEQWRVSKVLSLWETNFCTGHVPLNPVTRRCATSRSAAGAGDDHGTHGGWRAFLLVAYYASLPSTPAAASRALPVSPSRTVNRSWLHRATRRCGTRTDIPRPDRSRSPPSRNSSLCRLIQRRGRSLLAPRGRRSSAGTAAAAHEGLLSAGYPRV